MIIKMLNQAQYELMNYPHRGIGYYLGYPVSSVSGKNKKYKDKMGYPNAVLAKAMMDYYKKHVNSEEAREIMDIVRRYYGRWNLRGKKLYSIEDAYAGMALIDVYRITGEEKYKEWIDRIYSYVMQQETDETSSFITKSKNGSKYVSVETIGTVCPFLAKYGKVFDDPSAVNMAIIQIENYMSRGMDEKTLLPYHGYDSDSGLKMGIIGWGQAVGRLLNGLSEVLYYMDADKPSYDTIRQYYRRIVDKVETYQAEGGLYHWQLSAKDGPADTAATAQILVSIAQSLEDKVLIGIHRSRMLRGVEAIKACIQEDGTLPGAAMQADGFNNYPVEFGIFPWALGPALSLMVAVEEESTEKY